MCNREDPDAVYNIIQVGGLEIINVKNRHKWKINKSRADVFFGTYSTRNFGRP